MMSRLFVYVRGFLSRYPTSVRRYLYLCLCSVLVMVGVG